MNVRSAAESAREMDVPILMYHHVHPLMGPANRTFKVPLLLFEQHLEFLQRKGYHTITLAKLMDATNGGSALPPRAVVLTFDDGYESFHRFVYPALRSRGMVGTVFVVTSEIGGTNAWDAEPGSRQERLMTAEQIREVIDGGMEVGVHGRRHLNLSTCTQTQRRDEIVGGVEEFKSRLGMSPRFYCYAYGQFAPDCFELLRQADYHGAAAVWTIYSRVTSERFALRRIYVHERDSALRFRLKLTRPYLRYRAWLDRWNLRRIKHSQSPI
jgi:peptidoglycan/xylan/chitin deacetylase (PgdA/CDA1 family)